MKKLAFGLGVIFFLVSYSESLACDAGQSCSSSVEITEVTECIDSGYGYCRQETSTDTYSCSSESAGCNATNSHYTSCGTVAAGCPKTGLVIQVNCCYNNPEPTVPPCDRTNWTNGACGNGVNGCAYGKRIQTRTVDPSGCDTTSQCVDDAACPITAFVGGWKTLADPAPASVNYSGPPANASIASQTVSLNSPAKSNSNNPFSAWGTNNLPTAETMTWDTVADATRTVSVPALTGYNICSTMCYNDYHCHDVRTDSSYQLGTSRTISDNTIRSTGPSASYGQYYSSLWWHYAPEMVVPSGLTVGGMNPANLVCPAASYTVQWADIYGEETYALRSDNETNTWAGSCAATQFPGDACVDGIPAGTTSYSIPGSLLGGSTLNIWLHGVNSCRVWGTPSSVRVTVASTASISNLTATNTSSGIRLNWTAAPGATAYRIHRNNVYVDYVATNTYLDTTPVGTCGPTTYNYSVEAWYGNNPVNCRVSAGVAASTVWSFTRPAPPAAITARDDINDILVQWDSVSGISQYRLYRSGPIPTPQAFLTTVDGTSHLDQTVACGSSGYQYCVTSYNSSYPEDCRESATQRCSLNVSCADYSHPWFQIRGGGVAAASGQLQAWLPPANAPYPTPVLILPGNHGGVGPTGVPGAAYGVGIGGNLTAGNVSNKQWLLDITPGWGAAGSGLLSRTENQYLTIKDRVVSRVSEVGIVAGGVDANMLRALHDTALANNKINDVVIMARDGSGLTINDLTPINLGSRKMLIFVDGNVNINNNLTVDANDGFLAIIARGNINIRGDIGNAPPATFPYQYDIVNDPSRTPQIRAILYAGGNINTGDTANQLEIDGSLTAMGTLNLQRTSKGPYPAEFIDYNLRMTSILQRVGLRRITIQERL